MQNIYFFTGKGINFKQNVKEVIGFLLPLSSFGGLIVLCGDSQFSVSAGWLKEFYITVHNDHCLICLKPMWILAWNHLGWQLYGTQFVNSFYFSNSNRWILFWKIVCWKYWQTQQFGFLLALPLFYKSYFFFFYFFKNFFSWEAEVQLWVLFKLMVFFVLCLKKSWIEFVYSFDFHIFEASLWICISFFFLAKVLWVQFEGAFGRDVNQNSSIFKGKILKGANLLERKHWFYFKTTSFLIFDSWTKQNTTNNASISNPWDSACPYPC